MMLIRKNKRLEKSFKQYLKDNATTSTYSSYAYGYGGSYYSGYSSSYGNSSSKTIYFYEWGDISGISKKFYKGQEFIDFMNDSHICFTEEQRELLEKQTSSYNERTFYAVCPVGKNILLMAHNYWDLKNKLNEYVDNKDKYSLVCVESK